MRPECVCKSIADDVTQRTTEVLHAHFSGFCRDEQTRKTHVKTSSTKNFWRSPNPCSAGRECRFEFTDEFKAWLSTSTPSGSVRSWSHIFCGTSAYIGLFFVVTNKRFGVPRTNGGGTRRGSDISRKFRWKSRPDDWDVCASSDSVRICLPRKGDSSVFSQIVYLLRKKTVSQFSISIPVLWLLHRKSEIQKQFWNSREPFF
jgi:hypothetical protein